MEKFLVHLIRQRVVVCFSFVLLMGIGVYAFRQVPIDAVPDLTNNQVQIIAETFGMAPVETEQLVTVPIESVMNGLPRVHQIRSISKFGLSVITVVFEDGVDTYFARQLVNERLQGAKSRLPGHINPELGPISTAMGEIYQYVIEGKDYSATELRTTHDWDVKYQLRTVPGVNEVNSWGGYVEEYQVTLFPERLLQYHLSVDDVLQAISRNNENFSAGIIEHESEQYVVRGLGRANSLAALGQITIKTQQGVPVLMSSIARLEQGKALRQGAVTKDGQGEVVTGMVMMLKGENTRAVIARVKAKIAEVKKSLPQGISLTPFYDQTDLVEQTIRTVRNNLLEGGSLVIVVLLLMLGNLRAALIVALVIPMAMMFSFMGMHWLGVSANIMSLGAIDFGMIVDGSVVMVENTLARLAHRKGEDVGHSTLEVVLDSVREMARPILFGTLIIGVVYVPILSLEGMEYKMFSPMVFTVCAALFGSLLIALTLVPVLCSYLLRGNVSEKESLIVKWLKPLYMRSLDKALRFPALTMGITALAFVVSMASLPFMGSEFVPELDEGSFIIEVRNYPSISLTEAVKVAGRLEHAIKHLPEIKTAVSKIGRPELATEAMGIYQTDLWVMLKPRQEWRPGLTKDKLAEEMDALLKKHVIGASFNFSQPIAMRVDELVSGVRSDIAIKVFGPEVPVLQKLATQIQDVVEHVPGQTDLQVEKLGGNLQIVITPERDKMARYGINIEDIRNLTETAIIGKSVSEVIEGRRRIEIRMKFPQASNTRPDEIAELLIETADGQKIPLSQVATISIGEGLEVVNREFGQRRIIVQCNVRGRDMGSFVDEAQKQIAAKLKIPAGYYIQWGGQFENQQRAMGKLAIVVPLSILVIFFLLMGTFYNLKHALVVMINVPFALTGGVAALWLRGMYLSVPAAIGFIALFGVAVLNGIVLISTLNKRYGETGDMGLATRQAAEARLRPVLMTAMVASLGFLPMALSHGSGAEVQKPLATVVIGGLLTSTLLTLLVLPVIYCMFCRVVPGEDIEAALSR